MRKSENGSLAADTAERLQHARSKHYKSAEAAAKALGLLPVTYRKHEQHGKITPDQARMYAEAFECNEAWLAFGTSEGLISSIKYENTLFMGNILYAIEQHLLDPEVEVAPAAKAALLVGLVEHLRDTDPEGTATDVEIEAHLATEIPKHLRILVLTGQFQSN
ncbi:MAG: hypothetical protein KUG61_09555 [Parvibaculaceae bacterium]|nr:hypothetical protein [Parvibaculaceae bacterium]